MARFKIGDKIVYSRPKMASWYVNAWSGIIVEVKPTRVVCDFESPTGELVRKTVAKTRIKRATNDSERTPGIDRETDSQRHAVRGSYSR